MSSMSLGLSPPRASVSHHTTFTPPALQHTTIDCHNGPVYATSDNAFSGDTPRFPTDGTVRAAPHPRLYHPEAENLGPSGVSDLQAGSASSALQGSPAAGSVSCDLTSEDFDPAYANTTGPIRVDKSHSRRQPPGHIPRPRNAFILYRSWYVRQGFLSEVENDHREISRIVGKIWKRLSDDEKAPWKILAEEEKNEHARKYPNYKYSPNSRRDAAAAPSRSTPIRSSVVRSRKARAADPSGTDRSDDIAGAFLSGSRRESLTACVREMDERRRVTENPEPATQLQSPALTIRIPPPSTAPPPKVQRPCTPAQPRVHLGDCSHDSSSSGSSATPSEKPKEPVLPGTPPAADGQTVDDSWSLAACSAPLPDMDLTCEYDAPFSLLSYDYNNLQRLHEWAFRPGYNGDEALNTIMTCDDLSTEFRLLEFSTANSNLYSQPSTDATSQDPTASESELSPFDRIALEGTQAGHPGVAHFDTPTWDGLFQSSTSNTSSSSDSSSDFSWGHSQGYPVAEDSSSSSNLSMGDTHSFDYGLLSEWCNPDSPVPANSPEFAAHTPTSTSSGTSSPPLPITYPAPAYPQKQANLLCPSWGNGYEDLDAYERAVGVIRDELDGHSIFFGPDGLMETEGERV